MKRQVRKKCSPLLLLAVILVWQMTVFAKDYITDTGNDEETAVEQREESIGEANVDEGDNAQEADVFAEESAEENEESAIRVNNGDIFEDEEETAVSEDTIQEVSEILILDSENSDMFQAEDQASEEFLDQIKAGEMIGFAPVDAALITKASLMVKEIQDDFAVAAVLAQGSYYMEVGGRRYCDEVWTKEHDMVGGDGTRNCCNYRAIHYTDYAGTERTSPLYCMKASRDDYDEGEIRDEAIRAIQNSTIKKLLYYGYGGPGDICGEYDPTCSHIDWSKARNRYVFTHIAVSKVYDNDVGYATAQEVEHVGINRFINYIKNLTVPTHNGVELRVANESTWVSANPANINMILYRTRPSSMTYIWDRYSDGFQMSTLVIVSDTAKVGNGIKITRKAADNWQLLYWTDKADYESRGSDNPRVLSETGTITLKDDGRFKIVIPKSIKANQKMSFPVTLKPISFIMIDGKIQTGISDLQDMGAYVYQGTAGSAALNLTILPRGQLSLIKRSSYDNSFIKGASYSLYAAEDLYSGKIKRYSKNALVASGETDSQGQIIFTDLIPGAYFIKETKSPSGFLLDSQSRNVTVSSGSVSLTVKDVPDVRREITVKKTDGETGELLEGAEFEISEWNDTAKGYQKSSYKMIFQAESGVYLSDPLVYTDSNKGKFTVKETKNPEGYEGTFYKEINIMNSTQSLSYTAVNTRKRSKPGKLTVRKRIREADIIREHGNPVFIFTAEGTDTYGYSHKYEESLVYTNGSYQVDSQGYAYMELTFPNVPMGNYKVMEKPVMRYYLAGITGDYGEVNIIHVSEPSYGIRPEDIMYASVSLTEEAPSAGLTFFNEKQRFDAYSHTDIIENSIPVDFS